MQKLDRDDPRPQYLQVAQALRQSVQLGELEPGGRLPSHAEVAATYAVSVGTVKRAFGVLQDEGLIVSRQGQPAHVRSEPPPAAASVDDQSDVRAALAALERRLSAVEERLSRSSQ